MMGRVAFAALSFFFLAETTHAQEPAVISFSYGGVMVQISNDGRTVTWAGRNIDTMTRAQLLKQLHAIAYDEWEKAAQ
jgi:hypothetical protein